MNKVKQIKEFIQFCALGCFAGVTVLAPILIVVTAFENNSRLLDRIVISTISILAYYGMYLFIKYEVLKYE